MNDNEAVSVLGLFSTQLELWHNQCINIDRSSQHPLFTGFGALGLMRGVDQYMHSICIRLID
jgi:hypothetical protein